MCADALKERCGVQALFTVSIISHSKVRTGFLKFKITLCLSQWPFTRQKRGPQHLVLADTLNWQPHILRNYALFG